MNPERNHLLILAYYSSKAVVSQEANMDYSLQKLERYILETNTALDL